MLFGFFVFFSDVEIPFTEKKNRLNVKQKFWIVSIQTVLTASLETT